MAAEHEQRTRTTTELRERIRTTDALERIAEAMQTIAESSAEAAESSAAIFAELQVLNDRLESTTTHPIGVKIG